ncbi:hypothetical protein OV203_28375 [Nannocystis sp. ILAH1]|uniref:hypothetical protein n=1 Tax=unclassified Nannocystis TaxID=2627009 RepID=UPI002270D9B3|nr:MULTISPECIES: hypothetical protein [unclassified Nannocystis]MCY0991094.1 hypothetical protein [Nannocystis sp. ILAH1]MCY1064606.1 hypothetical protein [Nannocystis sp. RBIL2]
MKSTSLYALSIRMTQLTGAHARGSPGFAERRDGTPVAAVSTTAPATIGQERRNIAAPALPAH